MFWRLVSQLPVLKVVVPHVGYEPFTPQVETPGFEFSPKCELPHEHWGLWQDCVSTFPSWFDVVSLLYAECEGVTLDF